MAGGFERVEEAEVDGTGLCSIGEAAVGEGGEVLPVGGEVGLLSGGGELEKG